MAQRVPDISRRTLARLDRHDVGYGLPLESGSRTGLVNALEKRVGRLPDGFTRYNKTHAVAHAAAYLWLNPQVREATIYVNRPICRWPKGCDRNLPTMIPEGWTLTAFAPDGVWRVCHGTGRIEGSA